MAEKNPKDPKKPTPQERKLLDYIGQFESAGGDYNIVYGGYTEELDKPLTEMTVDEVLALQEKMKSSGSSAVGAYQMINSTLKEELKNGKISGDTLFTPKLQDTLILNRLRRIRGLDEFLAGKKTPEEFGLLLSKEFASIPNPETGKSYYDGDGLNKSLTDVDSMLTALENIRVDESLATGSSINPELILNSDLDEGTKEELLKLNEEAGLQPDTINQLQSMQPSMLTNLVNSQVPSNPVANENIVNSEITLRAEENGLGFNGELNAFPADFKLLNNSTDGEDQNKTMRDGGLINKFNTGGSHEQNPHGGIPVSKNPNGGNNLVEEGETMYQNYIFSDSLKLDKETAKRFHVDDKYVGKTLAEISERYNAEIDERPFDKIAVGTAKRELDKLILVNESLKPSEPASANMFPMGGLLPYTDKETEGTEKEKRKKAEDQQAQAINNGMDVMKEDIGLNFEKNTFDRVFGNDIGQEVGELDLGNYLNRGFFDVKPNGPGVYNISPTSANPQNAQGYKDQIKYLQKLNPNARINSQYTQFSNRSFNDGGHAIAEPGIGDAAAMAGDAAAMIGGATPVGLIAQAVGKAIDEGVGIGNSLFGDTGIDTSGSQRYDKTSVMDGMQGLDLLTPTKWATNAIFAGRKNKDANEANNQNTLAQNSQFKESSFNAGGPLPHNFFTDLNNYVSSRTGWNFNSSIPFGAGIPINRTFNSVNPVGRFDGGSPPLATAPYRNPIIGGTATPTTEKMPPFYLNQWNTPFIGKWADNANTTTPADASAPHTSPTAGALASSITSRPMVGRINTTTTSPSTFEYPTPQAGDLAGTPSPQMPAYSEYSQLGSRIQSIANEAMRLTPIARNLLRKKETPEITRLNRLDDRFRKSEIDEAAFYNRINNAAGNFRQTAREGSGGSLAAFNRNMQQGYTSQLRAISDAMFQKQGFDANQNQLEQQFNKDTNVRNQQIDEREQMINQQSRAATQLYNDTMRNAAFEDIGLLGRENKMADILERTSGYTVDGQRAGNGIFANLFKRNGGELHNYEEYLKKKYNG